MVCNNEGDIKVNMGLYALRATNVQLNDHAPSFLGRQKKTKAATRKRLTLVEVKYLSSKVNVCSYMCFHCILFFLLHRLLRLLFHPCDVRLMLIGLVEGARSCMELWLTLYVVDQKNYPTNLWCPFRRSDKRRRWKKSWVHSEMRRMRGSLLIWGKRWRIQENINR